MVIDLNCDLGESFGAYRMGEDEAMMTLVSSVNIACGFHAGDPQVMAQTVHLAALASVAIGAHPGYPDLQGFGRRDMQIAPREVEALIVYQVGALMGFCRAEGVNLVHVKPHGALYNQAMKNKELASAIVNAVACLDKNHKIVGLPGSELLIAAEKVGIPILAEGFPDRGYSADGTLMPRTLPGAIIHEPGQIAEHAVELASRGIGVNLGGQTEFRRVDTLCLHGDHPRALENAKAVRTALERAGIFIRKPE
jgi:UPF0271 protein